MRASLVVSLLLIASLFTVAGCHKKDGTRSFGRTEVKAADSFLTAFQAEEYKTALSIIDKKLKENPEDGARLHYRGSCLAMLDKHGEAVESFRLADTYTPPGFLDKTTLYLRAQSLFQIKANGLAQKMLDRLTKSFPHSRLAKRGQELALKIEERLARGITRKNLNWYLDKGRKAYDASRPALAIEYLEEYMLLAGRSTDKMAADDPSANFTLGGAYLELTESGKALSYLEKVPIEFGDYHAGIMRAIAHRANGDTRSALSVLSKVIKNAKKTEVRRRSEKYIKSWTPR